MTKELPSREIPVIKDGRVVGVIGPKGIGVINPFLRFPKWFREEMADLTESLAKSPRQPENLGASGTTETELH